MESFKSEKSPLLFKKICLSVCPNFEVAKNNRELVNELYFYAHGEGIFDSNKGLWFYGDVGTGKSTLMKIIAEYQRKLSRGFKCVNSASLAAGYASFGLTALDESTYNENSRGINPVERGFDEVGREPIPAKHYGNELNVMQYILQIRYDLKVKTHITTNITPESIEKMYGPHIYDRAFEMFNFIEMKGESRR